jgi:hypothetical protein
MELHRKPSSDCRAVSRSCGPREQGPSVREVARRFRASPARETARKRLNHRQKQATPTRFTREPSPSSSAGRRRRRLPTSYYGGNQSRAPSPLFSEREPIAMIDPEPPALEEEPAAQLRGRGVLGLRPRPQRSPWPGSLLHAAHGETAPGAQLFGRHTRCPREKTKSTRSAVASALGRREGGEALEAPGGSTPPPASLGARARRRTCQATSRTTGSSERNSACGRRGRRRSGAQKAYPPYLALHARDHG